MWGVIFLLATGMSVAKTSGGWAAGPAYQLSSWGLIGLGLWLNHWYPQYVRSKANTKLRS